jgi:hypothetical protein
MRPTIIRLRAEKRWCERRWRHSRLEIDRQIYASKRDSFIREVERAKAIHFNQKLGDASNHPKKLWTILLNLTQGAHLTGPLPSHFDAATLSCAFNNYFCDKVKSIKLGLIADHPLPLSTPLPHPIVLVLTEFSTVSNKEVYRLLCAPSKQSRSDPWSHKLLKSSLSLTTPYIAAICNSSLRNGTVPTSFKSSNVVPALKKHSLDRESLANYRPIANLPTLSKLLERVVLSKLCSHLDANDILHDKQTAYRTHHSTETTILKLVSYISDKAAAGKAVLFASFDLSSAFDTLDHHLLINQLCHYGVAGTALMWFTSYLSNRQQSVHCLHYTSPPLPLSSGVPQGSVLGPVLFNIFLAPLARILASGPAEFHIYADDICLYLFFLPSQLSTILPAFIQQLEAISAWTHANSLKLNPSKTVITIFGTKSTLRQVSISEITFAGSTVKLTDNVRCLGVVLDRSLTLQQHVHATVNAAYFHLRAISLVRKCLSVPTSTMLVNALVISRIDYCSSILHSLPAVILKRVQKVQNAAARVVLCRKKMDRASPLLLELNWLPVAERVARKIATIVFTILHQNHPAYLTPFVVPYVPSRSLRSQDKGLLTQYVPPISIGKRSLRFSSQDIWNSFCENARLARDIQTFLHFIT